MDQFTEIEYSSDRIQDVHQTILNHLGDSLPFLPQVAGHLLKQQKDQLRSRLTIRTAELFHPADQKILDLAGILEFLQASTMLHRRVHKPGESRRQLKPLQGIWGNEASVLLGDYLLSISFEILTRAGNLEVLEIISSATQNIALGQMLEVSKPFHETTSKDWEEITLLKYTSLFEAGAICATIYGSNSQEVKEHIGKFGSELGLAARLSNDLKTVCNQIEMLQALQEDQVLYPICLWLEEGLDSKDSKKIKKLLSKLNSGPRLDEKNWKGLVQWCWIPVQQKIEKHLNEACKHLNKLEGYDCSHLYKLTDFKLPSSPVIFS